MAIINNSFNGKMNLDRQAFRIQNGDYLEALNITRDSPGESEDMVVTNLVGNTLVSYELPTGINKVIGKFADKIRNRVYIFIWNSYDQDLIIYYDRGNDSMVTLVRNLTDTDGDVLNFNPSKKINHVDIIYDNEKGDLIFWTDGYNTPRKLNVTHIADGDYATIKTAFIEAAKAPILKPPVCEYGSDSTRNSNSLRQTMFQFCARPQYDDYEKGCLFSFSKIPLPVGFYGSDNNADNTKNNFITVTIETGDENVIALEIGMRYGIGENWSDVVLIASLNKAEQGIPDNSTYQFLFYNDAVYPTISDGVQYADGVQAIPLFFWTPQLADCQALANGTTPVYAAITEGYDKFPVNEIDVTITAENVTNIPPDTDPPTLTYENLGNGVFNFTVGGNIVEGTSYSVLANVAPNPGPINGVAIVSEYVAQSGDTITDVVDGLFASTSIFYRDVAGVSTYSIGFPDGSNILSITVDVGSGGGSTISTEKVWMNDCPYVFGLVYFDEQGRVMPGVITYSNPVDSDNDFLLTTPPFSLDGTSRQTPVISASINHLPPAGAVKYAWVRRRMQYDNWLEYQTCDFQEDTDFYYFCLANIAKYKEATTNFIYGEPPITESGNQRIKMIAGIGATDYDGDIYNADYQILGTVTRTFSGGSSPDDDYSYIKVKKPAATPSPAFQANMLVMVYTPFLNPTDLANCTYFEWGETFDIYELDGVNYHRGGEQDQTTSQPATFEWPEGDVYYHQRTMYSEILTDPFNNVTVDIMDESFSDFFISSVNDNGRAQVIEVNAQRTYNPVLVRFGGAYQSGTTVNNTPDFYFENYEEADRQWGDIRKLFVRGRYLRAYQKFNIATFPVLMQIVRDTAGNPLEANSDILINKVNYLYSTQVGIGDIPESFASDNEADYFASDYRNVVCRLSQDGVTILSVLYECNSFFTDKLPAYRKSLNNGYGENLGVYTGDPTVYGCFDSFTNKYIIALEEINRYNSQGYLTFHQDGYTLAFNEVRSQMEGFESFLSFKPENMVCLDTLFLSFKNGGTWKHGFGDRCNFYGSQYDAYITGVFNDNGLEKKSWMALTQLSNEAWEVPLMYSNVNTFNGQRQESKLIPDNFKQLEGDWHSSIMRDIHSIGGWVSGNSMKGNYLVVKFLKQNANELIYLNGVAVFYKDSALTSIK